MINDQVKISFMRNAVRMRIVPLIFGVLTLIFGIIYELLFTAPWENYLNYLKRYHPGTSAYFDAVSKVELYKYVVQTSIGIGIIVVLFGIFFFMMFRQANHFPLGNNADLEKIDGLVFNEGVINRSNLGNNTLNTGNYIKSHSSTLRNDKNSYNDLVETNKFKNNYCNKCGAKLDTADVFCFNCGELIKQRK